jgi:hypothetical protein
VVCVNMKRNYNGFEIEVNKGDRVLYYSAFRLSDEWIFISSVDVSEETIEEKIMYLIKEIDKYIADPEKYSNDEMYRY